MFSFAKSTFLLALLYISNVVWCEEHNRENGKAKSLTEYLIFN